MVVGSDKMFVTIYCVKYVVLTFLKDFYFFQLVVAVIMSLVQINLVIMSHNLIIFRTSHISVNQLLFI